MAKSRVTSVGLRFEANTALVVLKLPRGVLTHGAFLRLVHSFEAILRQRNQPEAVELRFAGIGSMPHCWECPEIDEAEQLLYDAGFGMDTSDKSLVPKPGVTDTVDRALTLLGRMEMPVVAVVHGLLEQRAIGLIAACQGRVLHQAVQFFLRPGLVGDLAPSLKDYGRLSATLAEQKKINAEEARRLGLEATVVQSATELVVASKEVAARLMGGLVLPAALQQ